jgi:hypothetical protein
MVRGELSERTRRRAATKRTAREETGAGGPGQTTKGGLEEKRRTGYCNATCTLWCRAASPANIASARNSSTPNLGLSRESFRNTLGERQKNGRGWKPRPNHQRRVWRRNITEDVATHHTYFGAMRQPQWCVSPDAMLRSNTRSSPCGRYPARRMPPWRPLPWRPLPWRPLPWGTPPGRLAWRLAWRPAWVAYRHVAGRAGRAGACTGESRPGGGRA